MKASATFEESVEGNSHANTDNYNLLGHRELFKCVICGKSFKVKGNLKRHTEIHRKLLHISVKYECKVCGKSFTHCQIKLSEKSFTCEVCGKSFLCDSVLNTHLSIHVGEKLFKCKVHLIHTLLSLEELNRSNVRSVVNLLHEKEV